LPRETRKSRPASTSARQGGDGLGALDLDLDDDLDSLFAEALAATEKRAARRKGPAPAPPPPKLPLSSEPEDPSDFEADASLHFMIDDVFDDGDLLVGDAALDDDGYFALDATEDDVPESIDELESDLKAALDEDEEDDEQDLQSEMERLLADSFDLGLEDDDLPEIAEEEGDEEILAVGDDGVESVLTRGADEELERLRNQLGELSRTLSIRDLELRTSEERVDTLESQMVATARQAANIGREFESFRRRTERDKKEQERFAGEKVVKEFLGVFDNLERALEHAGEARTSPLGQGVEMILGQFLSALKRCGVSLVDGDRGTEFDPAVHEAIGQEHNEEVDAGHILLQLQAGFSMGGRLVRAAVVSVSQGPRPEPAPEPEPESAAAEADETVEAATKPAPKKRKSTGARKKKKKTTARSRATRTVEEPEPEQATVAEAADAVAAAEPSPSESESKATDSASKKKSKGRSSRKKA
jgi:molecular chaperone GrpE